MEIDKIIYGTPVVILAGGKGINLGEKNEIIPKTMVKVKSNPLLKYIIDHYANYGFKKFIIACGYKQDLIKDYFASYSGPLDIKLVDTGIDNMTGSRLAQVKQLVEGLEMFCFTYGDTISDVNLQEELQFHMKHKRTATLVAAHYPTRFRILGLIEDEDEIKGLAEKPILEKDYINGGFYLLNKSIFSCNKLSANPSCVFEEDVLEDLVARKEIYAYRHNGIWQPLDNEKDRQKIIQLLKGGLK
jgi:glucose-1-phosphate cytidylyltransferase